MADISAVVEGPIDEAIVRRLVTEHGLQLGDVHGQQGKGWIDRKIQNFNHAARFSRWFILRDLDQDEACAPALVSRLVPQRADGLMLRIAVREAEAWLLADAEGVGAFFHLRRERVPHDPDGLPKPKRALVEACSRSKLRRIREGMVPEVGTTAAVGPEYTPLVREFVRTAWDWRRARARSDSLFRCVRALESWRR